MQSIKNAVFGTSENTDAQSGSEPISGKTGTEAYDAGNEAGMSALNLSPRSLSKTANQPQNLEPQ